MANEKLTFGRYEIIPIRLDLSCYLSYDFMILQLLFFLKPGSKKYVVFEIMVLLMVKKPFKPSRKLRRKSYIQLVKKTFKLDKKTRSKTGDSINKKYPKLNMKTRRKTNHLSFIRYFIEGEKPLKSS